MSQATGNFPIVDLRSDTLTRPSEAMLQAMISAELGDDVYGEDPTVNELERRAAEIMGKEAAMFTVTGTMANSLSIRLQTEPGDEVLMHRLCHPFHHEGGSPASISGVTIRPLEGESGCVTPETLAASLRPPARHMSRQRMFWMENTHNAGGGAVLGFDTMRETSRMAHEAGLKVHIDGARIFNASVASGVPVQRYASVADTISFCLSKGLGAPVGSLLCGPAGLIDDARRFRHMLGGGWRQAGVLAAAGIYALENNRARLALDHANARTLADAIAAGGHLKVTAPVQTNMVMFAPVDPNVSVATMIERLAALGIRVGRSTCGSARAVTHLDIDSALMARAVEVFQRFVI
ncbi:MAG TPA: low specificity L-threonine aldolase [Myxococcota bacterium]|nr:low specificity L-threonine aldolase [Myxococcota bacterium]HNZ04123.1 low specificity L-threonine aldolase [Myxococcota bacterium]HOD08015.1 low specificity L-threonine aldolase [Myxococcota bacterium]HPB50346.1 low specificity L-threonine aldolase [Myxococcota bacterium]HQP95428.1 low specificity L-threonine aldolase [Myxococcota bacterium]